MFVDDEGLVNGSPLNLILTVLAHQLGAPAALFGSGVVVSVDDEGNAVDLSSDAQRRLVTQALATKPDPGHVRGIVPESGSLGGSRRPAAR